jgi:hypothetical protein
MTPSKHSLKALLAGFATVALVGTAVAQSTPPTTANPNPATGAGQQSSQATPMGTTGTQTGGTMDPAASSSSGTSGASGTTMGSGSSSGTMADNSAATSRPARADRN